MDGLNMGIIKAMPIPVPPICDQVMFAEKVQQLAGARQTVQRAVLADDTLFASLQSRAFNGDL